MRKLICLAITFALLLCTVTASASFISKDTVKEVQKALNDAGYNCGTPDGVAGKNTKKAITDYQKDNGLAASGIIDDSLLRSLGLSGGESSSDPEPAGKSSGIKTGDYDYSTNSKSSIKNGNKGVYSYRTTGGTYYNYLIVDFDEGYVYSFADGNGDETCERVKIASGDLNSVMIITYHDGGDEWSYGLHFKWKNQPDHLIFQEESGFETDFYSTDLMNAIKLRDSRKIINY